MKPKRGWRGWIGLGVAVTALAGGVYAGKCYAERQALATLLGAGAQAESIQWHWRQAAGCAEEVEVPLAYAKDINNQALQLYAPKLWFVYDQSALLRKRFILPRVVMEDVLITSGSDGLTSQAIVDIDFDPGMALNLVELPAETIGSASGNSDQEVLDAPPVDLAKESSIGGSGPAVPAIGKKSSKWLDRIQGLCESLIDDRTIAGRQVAIDAQMLSERVEVTFVDSRAQAQRLLSEARDIQQQVVNTDNLLRQGQLNEIARRLDAINAQLINLKFELGHVNKRLDEEQARIRVALQEEKKDLLQQAEQFEAPEASEVAHAVLTTWMSERLSNPARAAVLLADMMRKPLQHQPAARGQDLRYLNDSEPAFAARSTSMRGKLEMDGHAWPFEAQGSFEVGLAPMPDSAGGESGTRADWELTIQAQPEAWQLTGSMHEAAGPCTVKVASVQATGLQATGLQATGLQADCLVQGDGVSGKGRLNFRESLVSAEASQQLSRTLVAEYGHAELLGRLMAEAWITDDSAPELFEFEAAELRTLADCQWNGEAMSWLSKRLQTSASGCVADKSREAAVKLESSIQSRLNEQKGLLATLRKDAEQFLGAQHDELRKIMSNVNGLIEQRQSSYYFARQPGDMPR